MTSARPDPPPHPIIFYDGLCGLCDAFVAFVLRRDERAIFRFAPLQGEIAHRELPPRGGRPQDLRTVYLLTTDGALLAKSRAVLSVLQALGGPWRLATILRLVPTPLADLVYAAVARLRYLVFGRRQACRLPTAAERSRFLEPAGAPSNQYSD